MKQKTKEIKPFNNVQFENFKYSYKMYGISHSPKFNDEIKRLIETAEAFFDLEDKLEELKEEIDNETCGINGFIEVVDDVIYELKSENSGLKDLKKRLKEMTK